MKTYSFISFKSFLVITNETASLSILLFQQRIEIADVFTTISKYWKPRETALWCICIRHDIFTLSPGPLFTNRNWFKIPAFPAWKRNHIPNKLWEEITYPSSNFNGWSAEDLEWISKFILLYDRCNYLSMLGLKLIHVDKMVPGFLSCLPNTK